MMGKHCWRCGELMRFRFGNTTWRFSTICIIDARIVIYNATHIFVFFFFVQMRLERTTPAWEFIHTKKRIPRNFDYLYIESQWQIVRHFLLRYTYMRIIALDLVYWIQDKWEIVFADRKYESIWWNLHHRNSVREPLEGILGLHIAWWSPPNYIPLTAC